MRSDFSTQFLISLRFILKLSALLFFTSSAYATTYFQDCKTALAEPSFHVLRAYLDSVGNQLEQGNINSNPNQCFQVTDSEFGVISYDGVFYCDVKDNPVCKVSSSDFVLGNLVIKKEFDSDRGKHVVLLFSAFERQGQYRMDYSVLFLGSKRIEGTDPFKMQWVAGVSGDEYSCDVRAPVSTNFRTPEYRIIKAGQKNVSLVFNMVKENCKTHRKTNFQRRFVLRDGNFLEIHGNK